MIVLIRDPVATFCSLLLKKGHPPSDHLLRELFEDYIEYHVFVEEKLERLKIEADVRGYPKCLMAQTLYQRLIMHDGIV
jgi:hypothetical protein